MPRASKNNILTAMFSCLTRMKSRMVSIIVPLGSSIAGLKRFYVKFCKETTLHGLKHTVSENYHWLERWLWFILTGMAFYGAVYCGLSQLSRYNSEPVVVSMQRDFRSWWTVFPAVTACFLDRVQPEKARNVIESTWNVTEESDPEKYQYYYSFIELVTDVSFRTNLQNFWKYQTDDTVKDIDLLQLALNVHPTFPLKVTVSKKDKEVEWIPVMTEMGICMTFNSEYAVYQFLLNEVELDQEPLLQCHYHSAQCYVRIDTFNNAVRYFVHSPYDIPSAISNPTGEVLPGEEMVIDFKVIEIEATPSVKKLRLDQRRCRYPDEWLSDTIRAYSYGLCQMHCRSRMAVMFCGCRPYFHVKGDGVVCDAHGMACIGRNVEILINLPKNLAKCSCLPQCAELNYFSHTKKVVVCFFFHNMSGMEADGESGSVAGVRFNLMPPKFRLHRDVIFTLEDLFASLGGTTALFVGASVLTVVETVFFLIIHLVQFMIRGMLPFGLDVGLVGTAAYYLTRLKKPDPQNVISIFGPDPVGKDAKSNPEKVAKCVAHRGANLDAPENTLAAFKYCIENDCKFVELDVRSCADGNLILLHDRGLDRIADTHIPDVHSLNWESIKMINVAAKHPNREKFKEVHPCLFDEAVQFLLENGARMIIDVKGEDSKVIEGVVKAFETRPSLHRYAVVTCFNPLILYQIRKKNPQIVGALSYRPYAFSAEDYEAEVGPISPRYGDNMAAHAAMRLADLLYSAMWRLSAKWCNVSAVLLHKDIVSPSEVSYWRRRGVRCAGWSVNRPLEKLYWRTVLKAPYLAGTLLGEPPSMLKDERINERTNLMQESQQFVENLLVDSERNITSGQN